MRADRVKESPDMMAVLRRDDCRIRKVSVIAAQVLGAIQSELCHWRTAFFVWHSRLAQINKKILSLRHILGGLADKVKSQGVDYRADV
jgi:hypothetical protein